MKKAMKLMAMVLFMVSLTTFTSCTKSKDKLILGSWELTTISMTYGEQSITMTWAEFMQTFGLGVESESLIFEFKNDGTLTASSGAITGASTVTYSIDGDKLSMNDGEETIEMTIVTLTSSALVLEAEEDDITETLTFKKA